MATQQLPSRPSLEQYKKQAKALHKAHKSADPEAVKRIREHHPKFSDVTGSEILKRKFALADAQVVIAREHGFESWPKIKKHIDTVTSASDMQLGELNPVLLVDEVTDTLDYYRDKLGFTVDWAWGNPPTV